NSTLRTQLPVLPRIGPPGDEDYFHDSSLVDVQLDPSLSVLRVILSTPDQSGNEKLWMITLDGVLRLEFETSGKGDAPSVAPLEVYSVYEQEGDERQRWVDRLQQLGESRQNS